MNANVHRWLMTIGSIAAGAGGVLAIPDAQILGIPPEVGAAMAIIAGFAILIANAIRANFEQ